MARAPRPVPVGIDDGALAVVQRWIDIRQHHGLARSRHLFCTLQGKPLRQTYVRTMIARYAGRAGITKRVHPHGLRHTYAAELAREGVSMNVIQVLLGHSSLATTSRYLTHISPTEAIAASRSRKWTL